MAKFCRIPAKSPRGISATDKFISDYISSLNIEEQKYFFRLFLPGHGEDIVEAIVSKGKSSISEETINLFSKNVEQYLAEYSYEMNKHGYNNNVLGSIIDSMSGKQLLSAVQKNTLSQIYDNRKLAKLYFAKQNYTNSAKRKYNQLLLKDKILDDVSYFDIVSLYATVFGRYYYRNEVVRRDLFKYIDLQEEDVKRWIPLGSEASPDEITQAMSAAKKIFYQLNSNLALSSQLYHDVKSAFIERISGLWDISYSYKSADLVALKDKLAEVGVDIDAVVSFDPKYDGKTQNEAIIIKELFRDINKNVEQFLKFNACEEKSRTVLDESDGETSNDSDWEDNSAEKSIESTLSESVRRILSEIPRKDENGKLIRNSIGIVKCYNRAMLLDTIVELSSSARSSEEMLSALEKGVESHWYLRDVVDALRGASGSDITKLFCSVSKASLRFMVDDPERGILQKNLQGSFSRSRRAAIAAIKNELRLTELPAFSSLSSSELIDLVNDSAGDIMMISHLLSSGDYRDQLQAKELVRSDFANLKNDTLILLQRCGISISPDEFYRNDTKFVSSFLPAIEATGVLMERILSSLKAGNEPKNVLLSIASSNVFIDAIKSVTKLSFASSKSYKIGRKTYYSFANSSPILDLFNELSNKPLEEKRRLIDSTYGNDLGFKDKDGKYYGIIGAIYNGEITDLHLNQMMDFEDGKQLQNFNEVDLWMCWLKMFAAPGHYLPLPLFSDRQTAYFSNAPRYDKERALAEISKFLYNEVRNLIEISGRIPLIKSEEVASIKNIDVKINKDGEPEISNLNFKGFASLNSAKIVFKNEGIAGYNVDVKDSESGVVIEVTCPQSVDISLLSDKEDTLFVDFIRGFYSQDQSSDLRFAVHTILNDTGLISKLADTWLKSTIEKNKVVFSEYISRWLQRDADTAQNSIDEKSAEKKFYEIIEGSLTLDDYDSIFAHLYDGEFVSSVINSQFISDFITNMIIHNASFCQMTFGDLFYFKDATDFLKRNRINASSGIHLDITAKWDDELVGSEYSNVVYVDDQILSISDSDKSVIKDALTAVDAGQSIVNAVDDLFNNVNTTDGQSWLTFSGYRRLQIMSGRWGKMKENIYQKYIQGRLSEIDMTEMEALFVPQKTVTNSHENVPFQFINEFGNSEEYSKRVPVLHKDSESLNPLVFLHVMSKTLPNNTSFKKLAAIMDYCEKNDIDKIAMSGCVKTGINHVLSEPQIEIMSSGAPLPSAFIHKISNRDKYIQGREVDHGSNDNSCLFSSQIMKILYNNINDDEIFLVDGDEYTGKQLKQEYNELIGKILCREYIDIAERITDPTKVAQLMTDMASEEGIAIDPNLIEALKVSSDGDFVVPKEIGFINNQVVSVITSIMRKRVGRLTMSGGLYVQRSNWGFSDDLHVIRNKDGQLEFECYLPAYSKELYKDFILPDGTMDMESVPEELRVAIGVRIPTVDRNYGMRLRVVGFSPRARGSEIILPTIVTELNGSDFDIDKLYVTRPYITRKIVLTDTLQKIAADQSKKSFAAKYKEITGEDLWGQIKSDNPRSEESLKNRLFKINCALLGGGTNVIQQMHKADKTPLTEASLRGEIFRNYDMDTLVDAVNSLIKQGRFTPKQDEFKNGYPKSKKGYLAVIEIVSGTKVIDNGSTSRGRMKGGWRGNYTDIVYLPPDDRLTKDQLVELNNKINTNTPLDPSYYSHMLEPLMGGKALTAQFAIFNGAAAYCQAKSLYVKEKRLNCVLNGNIELDKTPEGTIAVDKDAKRLGSRTVSSFASAQGWTSKSHMLAAYCDVAVDNAKDMLLNGLQATRVSSQVIGFMCSLGYTPNTITTLLIMPGIYEALHHNPDIGHAIKDMKDQLSSILRRFTNGYLTAYNNGFAAGGVGQKYAPFIAEGKNMQTGNVKNNKFIYGNTTMMLSAVLNRRKYSLDDSEQSFLNMSDDEKPKYASYLKIVATALDNMIRLSTVSASYETIIQKSRSNTAKGGIKGTAQQSLSNLKKYDAASTELANIYDDNGASSAQTSPIVISSQDEYKFKNFIYSVTPLDDPGADIDKEIRTIFSQNPINKIRQRDLLFKMVENRVAQGATFYDFFEALSIRSSLFDILHTTITGSNNYSTMVNKLAKACTYSGSFGSDLSNIVDKDFVSYLLTAAVSTFDGLNLMADKLDVEQLVRDGKITYHVDKNQAGQDEVVYPSQQIKIGDLLLDIPEVRLLGNANESYENYSGVILMQLFDHATSSIQDQSLARAEFAKTVVEDLISAKRSLSEKGVNSRLLGNLSLFEVDGATTIRLPESMFLDREIISGAHDEFRTLITSGKINNIDLGESGKRLANNLILYCIMQNGCNFGGDGISLLLPPIDVCLSMNGLIRNILSLFGNPIETNGNGPRMAVCDSFLTQFIFNHLNDLFLPKVSAKEDVARQGDSISIKMAPKYLCSGVKTVRGDILQSPRPLIIYDGALYKIDKPFAANNYKSIKTNGNNGQTTAIVKSDGSSDITVIYRKVAPIDHEGKVAGMSNGYFYGISADDYINNINSNQTSHMPPTISLQEELADRKVIKADSKSGSTESLLAFDEDLEEPISDISHLQYEINFDEIETQTDIGSLRNNQDKSSEDDDDRDDENNLIC